jgi:signal transduction histidine kinase
MTGRKGTIRIITKKENDEILLSVRDDGCGFDPAAVEFDGSQHVGIRNVKDRIFRLLGGRVDVESKVGEGTVVTFHIPNKLLIN